MTAKNTTLVWHNETYLKLNCQICFIMHSPDLFWNVKFQTLFLDSPMDMSVVEGEDKSATVYEVPEYASEIHTYLREMEVNCSNDWMRVAMLQTFAFSKPWHLTFSWKPGQRLATWKSNQTSQSAWEPFWWTGWWRLERSTSFRMRLFIWLWTTLIASSPRCRSWGANFS